MFTGIAHLAFVVSDMKKTLHFYCEQLKCSHAFSLSDGDGNPWIEYVKVADGQFIEFFYPKGEIARGDSGFMHLCLGVHDIHEAAQSLKAAGVVIRIKPTQGKDGNWQCWIDDPDGNAIELMQIDPASPQALA